ncbi:MAG: putative family peptidase [Marmoricola sp.]|nr:putative family peptidase [Marmoricola sp.]
MKRVVVLIVCSVLAITVSGFTGAQAEPVAPAQAAFAPTLAAWASCSGGGMQCSTLTVPLDYANPDNGKTVKIAVSRVLADPTAGAYQGIMVVNPGGPGGSGLPYANLQGAVPNGGGMTYDWIGFDPRGVGSSQPSLHCNSHYFGNNRPDFKPSNRRLMRYWIRKTNGYAAACGRSAAKPLLPFMSTRDVVKDMESLRVAYQAQFNPLLDAAKIAKLDTLNFYGFSYGSYLGQVYATMYPNRVGKFVLDGIVDPTNYWYGANLQQEIFFDRNINVFFNWMARHHSVFHLGRSGKNIRAGFNLVLKQLDKHPLANGRLGPDELTDAMLDAGYYVYDWATIGAAYSDLVRHHHGKALFDMYAAANQGDDNGYAVYDAVQCTDVYRPPFRKQMRDARRINRTHPFLAWDNTWYNAPCFHWPAPSHQRVYVTGARVTGKVLLINETLDAATPYSGALTVRGRFPTSRLIAGVGGTTHASSLSGVACVDDRIASFLATGALPARVSGRRADVNCPHVPPPPANGSSRVAFRMLSAGMSPALREELMAAQTIGLR